MERVICVVIGYVFGLFQTGFLYGKSQQMDIREHGSGNAGTTNVLRTMGVKAGLVTFLGDFFKCILAVILAKFIFRESHPDMLPLLGLYAGLGAVLGHNFPFYLKFKGGKGVATSAGLLCATNIWIALIAMGTFIVVVAITKYVSVASIVLIIIFAIGIITYGQMDGFMLGQQSYNYEMYAIAIFLMILTIIKHKANIKRLLAGTESKITDKKKKNV